MGGGCRKQTPSAGQAGEGSAIYPRRVPLIAKFTSSIRGGVFYVGEDGEFGEESGNDEFHPLLGLWPALIIVNVENGGLGETEIRIAATEIDDPVGPVVFDGSLHFESGRLRIGDAEDATVIWVPVPPGDLRVRLHAGDSESVVRPDRKWWLSGHVPNRLDIVLPDL
jgi:hypothetical protein